MTKGDSQCLEELRSLRHEFQRELLRTQERYETQLADVKQVIMLQDEFYSKKIRQLETTLQAVTLQGNCMDEGVLKDSGDTGALATQKLAALQTRHNASATHVQRAKELPARRHLDIGALTEGLREFSSQLEAIFDFYTISHAGLFHPSMGLAQFSKFVRDCHLCRGGCTPELLWMAVMRTLAMDAVNSDTTGNGFSDPTALHPLSKNPRWITSEKLYLSSASLRTENFAVNRLELISKELFASALVVLSEEWRCDLIIAPHLKQGFSLRDTDVVEQSPSEVLAVFLNKVVLTRATAVVARATRRGKGLSSVASSRMDVSAFVEETLFCSTNYEAVIQRYEESDVVAIRMKQHTAQIKRAFQVATQREGGTSIEETMSIEAFVGLVRRHGLLPLTTKMQLKHIFECCAFPAGERDALRQATKRVPGLTFCAFVHSLYCLADCIYGAAVVASQYPTCETRLQKLLSKMFVLSGM